MTTSALAQTILDMVDPKPYRFDPRPIPHRLRGPRAAPTRRAIMSLIAGRQLPLSACGYHACRNALAHKFGVVREHYTPNGADFAIDAAIRRARDQS